MTKRKLVFFLFIVFSVVTFAQKVKVHAVNERLDEVLKKLKVEISFDNKALSKYKVTVDKTFDSPDKAIKYLLSQTSYNYQYIGGVYVISKNTAEKKKINVRFEILDVIPSMAVNLKEIIITTPSFRMNYEQSKTGNIAYMPAQTAKYIPGNADNSVFNLLRMMPGVRTAGEPSNELYVWGSSPGESRVVMDGIPLFAMQSFNNNISYINPYMAGEIRFNKGGLNVNEQSQIGAVAEISSNDNVIRKPTLKLALSTLTANVYGSLPLSKRFTLSAAYRHTLYNMFSNQIFNPERNHNGENVQYTTDSTAIDLVPSYSFQDLNLNLYGSLNKADKLKFAFYGVKDDFSYEGANDNVMQISGARNNKQLGSSAQYSKSWNDSSKMDVSAFYTYFKSNQSSHSLADNKQENNYISNQRVRQINGQITQYGIGKYRDLKVGGEMTYYGIVDSCTTSYVKPTLFVSDSIRYKSLSIDAGIRADIVKEGFRPQPRISAKYNFSKRFSLSGTWGIYRQYLVKLISESASNKYYTLQWGINSQLKSYCAVLGANYEDNSGFSVSVDGYLKNVKNYIVIDKANGAIYSNPNIRGIDVFLKKDMSLGTLFGSYSLNAGSPQTQNVAHEAKIGGMIKLGRFVLSSDYVFSTGYNDLALPMGPSEFGGEGGMGKQHFDNDITVGGNYSRWDIGANYRKRFRHFSLSSSISFINILNTSNTKYSSSTNLQDKTLTLFSQSSKFTPVLLFEIIF